MPKKTQPLIAWGVASTGKKLNYVFDNKILAGYSFTCFKISSQIYRLTNVQGYPHTFGTLRYPRQEEVNLLVSDYQV